MAYGIFGTYLLNSELQSISGMVRGLPPIPHDYTLWEVKNDNDVNTVLKMMKMRNNEIDMKYPEESSGNIITLEGSEYDDECFLVILWFTIIFDYWCGKKIVEYVLNPHMNACFDDLCMNIWNWIRGEISTNKLKSISKKFYKEVIKAVK